MVPTRADVDALLAALELQRASLGDAAVDFVIAAVRREWQASAVAAGPKLRQVSMLFCDVADSTAMLQSLRAEDALEVLNAPLQRFARLIEQAGGKVLRFSGDGLKAAFGAEQAHEDDARRAVAAGLAILDEAREHAKRIGHTLGLARFQVRVGINTGEVLLGGGVENDGTAMGHAVHIAARLEQCAAPGQLCIAHSTQTLVRGQFEMREQPPLLVKGNDAPLRTHLVLGPAHGGERPSREMGAPMVGRNAQLAELRGLAHGVLAGKGGRAALVLADAGAGKSRLLYELRATQTSERWLVMRSSAAPEAQLRPYGVLHDLITGWLGMPASERAERVKAQLVSAVHELLGATGTLSAHMIGRLIGLDFPDSPHLDGVEGRQLHERGFRAMLNVLQALAARTPLLLLVEDLHWVDDGSLDFLQALADVLDKMPIAIIATARPGLRERRAQWWSAQPEITLAPLDTDAARLLAQALLQHMPDSAAIVDALTARAGGNPYFMQELVHKLVDDGLIEVGETGWRARQERLDLQQLPATLVGVLQARLDALPADEREALQQASIVGSVFWAEALDNGSTALLPRLVARRLVHPRAASAINHAREFSFQHALLHEVTYATALKPMRREGHARAARWLAQRLKERSGEFLSVVATHYEKAGDSEHALEAFERAARDAFGRFAHAAALSATERGLAQPALTDAAQRFGILRLRANIGRRTGDRDLTQSSLAALKALAESVDDDGMRADAFSSAALQADFDGDHVAAAACAERALACAERRLAASYDVPTAIAMVVSRGEMAWIAIANGDHAKGSAEIGEAMPLAQRLSAEGRPTYRRQLILVQVQSLLMQERLYDAVRALETLAEDLDQAHHVDALAYFEQRSMLAMQLGELNHAERLLERMLAVAQSMDIPRWQCAALDLCARNAALRGIAPGQQRFARLLAEMARAAAIQKYISLAAAHEGEALQALGEQDSAHEHFTRAIESFRNQGLVAQTQHSQGHLALLQWSRGERAAALALVGEVLQARPLEETSPEALVCCARVLRAAGDSRAVALLNDLHTRLQRLLANSPSEERRRPIVDALPHWRWVLQARAQGTAAT